MKLLNDHERILPKNYVLISFTYSQRKNTSIILFYVFWPAESKSEVCFWSVGQCKTPIIVKKNESSNNGLQQWV